MSDYKSTNLKEELDAVDKAIERYKANIVKGEDLKFLMKLPQFKRLILEGYFETEAKKLFTILTDPTGVSPISEDEIHQTLAGISHFKGYVGTRDFTGSVMIDAETAPDHILREEQYRKEITAEAATEK